MEPLSFRRVTGCLGEDQCVRGACGTALDRSLSSWRAKIPVWPPTTWNSECSDFTSSLWWSCCLFGWMWCWERPQTTISASGTTAINYSCALLKKKHLSSGQIPICHLFFCLFTNETPIIIILSIWQRILHMLSWRAGQTAALHLPECHGEPGNELSHYISH